jgi:hypothetical protein
MTRRMMLDLAGSLVVAGMVMGIAVVALLTIVLAASLLVIWARR